MLFIKENDFCFKFDFHSAYHRIDIFEPHTIFLGFDWHFEGKTKFFKFTVLQMYHLVWVRPVIYLQRLLVP